jgi:Lysozyme like domain
MNKGLAVLGIVAAGLATGAFALLSPSGSYGCPQLEALWIEAGGSPADAVMAAGIARAESSGNVMATDNDGNGTTDYGLWQINSVNGGTVASYVPLVNAEQAVGLYDKNGWSPWITFQRGTNAGQC